MKTKGVLAYLFLAFSSCFVECESGPRRRDELIRLLQVPAFMVCGLVCARSVRGTESLADAREEGFPGLAQRGIGPGDFDPTLAMLREGVIRVARERALEEVDGWERRLREADDRALTPIADNLARLRIELERDTLDGVVIGGLMATLAGQVRDVASHGTAAESAEPVAGKLEDLGKLLEVESGSISDPDV